jgi:hypothetical protein
MANVHFHFDTDLRCTRKTCTHRADQPPVCEYQFSRDDVILTIRLTEQEAWSVGDTFLCHLVPTGPAADTECAFITRYDPSRY